MKHITLLVIAVCSMLGVSAQTLSLADALERLNRQQSDYEISFIHNELEHLQVVADAEDMSVPKAVKRMTKNQPVRVVTKGRQIFVQYKPKTDNRKIWLAGKVCDYVTHLDLPHSTVRLLTADGQLIDSCEAISFTQYGNNPPIEHSEFAFQVPARPANYIIKASYVGFQTTEMPYTFDNIYRREQRRELPPVYMKRESRMLQEVVVTATKVQFYYKGDTLVFNADAFELAEGSMLDALVRQLPGVELKEGGRIYHNGKYVDALLLNGKDFFRGDHTIMLDNLPTYTVKTIEIYDKWGDQSEFLGQHVMGDNRYVMDVKLKKEYSIGTMANVEAGGGTSDFKSEGTDRWLFRLFALRFTDHSRLAAYATANNLNGDRKPGETGSWDPQRLQNGGRLTQQQAGIDYSVDDRNSRWKADGNVQVTHTDLDRQTNTTTTATSACGTSTCAPRSTTRSSTTPAPTHRLPPGTTARSTITSSAASPRATSLPAPSASTAPSSSTTVPTGPRSVPKPISATARNTATTASRSPMLRPRRSPPRPSTATTATTPTARGKPRRAAPTKSTSPT